MMSFFNLMRWAFPLSVYQPGVAAAVGAVATVAGGAMASSASSKASKAQQAAADRASATELEMFNRSRDDQADWRDAGGAALNRLSLGLGLTPQAKTREQIRAELLPSYTTAGTSSADAELARRDRIDFQKWIAQNPDSRGELDPYWDGVSGAQSGSLADKIRFITTPQKPGAPGASGGSTPGSINEAGLNAAIEAEFARQNNVTKDPFFGSFNRAFGTSDLGADPIYQERLRVGLPEGQNNIMRMMSSRGGLESGAAMKALTRFNQDYVGGEGVNAFNRFQTNRSNILNPLESLAGVGQTTAAQLGNQAIQTGQSIAGNQIGAGNARASGYVGSANALTGAIGQGVNAWNQNRLLSQPAYQPSTGMATNNTGGPAWMLTGGGYGGAGGGV